jgi:methionyl-tRNA formyltransferase
MARAASEPVRTIWLGMRCDYTRETLEGALAAGGVVPVMIVLPRGPRPLGAGWPEPPFDRWLRERGIAVLEVARLAGEDLDRVIAAIQGGGIALGVAACFPWKAPASLRASLPGGVLNIHPSLLPALRGPEPVLHTLRLGLAESGVTVHLMDDGWDSGPVLAQERVTVPPGIDAVSLEADLARRGGRLLAELAPRWLAGDVEPTPQDHAAATWAPSPEARPEV